MADIASIIGDPRQIGEELRSFRETARHLSDDPTIAECFKGQWVGVHGGQVRAHGDTIDKVLRQLDAAGYVRSQVIVQYIHKEPRTLIL